MNQNPQIEVESSKKNIKGSVFGILMIMAAVAFYIFYTGRLAREVKNLETELTVEKESISAAVEKIEKFAQLEQDFGLTTEVEKFEAKKAVPIGINQDDVIRDIINIVKTYDIDLKSLSFGKGGGAGEIKNLKINASFEGSYSDLTYFLEALEQNPRTFSVENINVQIATLENTGFQRASFSLSINAFYQ